MRPGGEDRYAHLPFPEKGLDVSAPLPEQPEGTTPEAVNVRLCDPLTSRDRGGSRPGLAKYIDAQVNGTGLIQHLNIIVSVQGEALGWGFDPIAFPPFNQEDYGPAGYGGDPEGPDLGGGGGYQPSASFQDKRPKLTMTVDDSTQPADGTTAANVTVTARNRRTDELMPLVPVELHTSPSGRVGDGAQLTTNGLGVAVFQVTDNTAETVTYSVTAENAAGTTVASGRNTVSVTYSEIVFVQANSAAFTGVFVANTSRSCAFASPVQVGDLLLCAITYSPGNGPESVTDSLGHTYTFVRDGTASGAGETVALYYAVATSAGACTVTANETSGTSPSGQMTLGILAYRGTGATPLDGSVEVNSQAGSSSWSTGNIPVTAATGLLVGCFCIEFTEFSALAAGAGVNSRVSYSGTGGFGTLHVFDVLPHSGSAAVTGTAANTSANWAAVGASFKT